MVSAPPPAFGFASPWLLAGLSLAAIPVVIHLLFRRPYRDVPWAATRFLLSATRKHAKRLRLEQLLLLAVRVAALLLVAVALARPYVRTPKAVAGPEPPRHRVILLDASYSMGLEAGGRTRLDLAKQAAREVVESAKPGDAFHLVRMTDLGPRVVIGRPAHQPAQVLEVLTEQSLSFGRADPLAALRETRSLLKQASQLPNKEVLILSDFQQSDWRPAGAHGDELRRLLDEIGKVATVRLFDAGAPDASNAAVADLAIDGPFVQTGHPARLTATVRRNGNAERRRERVELHVDGRLSATEVVELRPDENATVAFSHTFAERGAHAVQVRLAADPLPADDVRYLAVDVRDRLRVLLVNGTPAGRPERTATFYLRQALAPAGTDSAANISDFEPTVIDEGDFDDRELDGFDVVLLANVGIVTDREADRLRAFAAAGGGVILALGDNTRPEAYNRIFADARGRALLPIRIAERIGDPARPQQAMQFDTSDLTHPIVRPFAGNPGTGLETDFVLAYAKAVTDESATKTAVPLRFDTGDPVIIAGTVGSGRVLLLTTSFDTTWGGPWPQAGRSFLPLVHETIRFAATGRPPGRAVRVGEPLVWTLPARATGSEAAVQGPGDLSKTIPAAIDDDGLRMVFADTVRPGIYTTSLASPIERSELFAANVDPNEGDLTRLSDDDRTVLAPRAKSLVPGLAQSASAAGPDWSVSRWLLAAAFGLLLVEQVLAWRFSRGLLALAAVAALLVTRATWLADPFFGSAIGVLSLGGTLAGAIRLRRRD